LEIFDIIQPKNRLLSPILSDATSITLNHTFKNRRYGLFNITLQFQTLEGWRQKSLVSNGYTGV